MGRDDAVMRDRDRLAWRCVDITPSEETEITWLAELFQDLVPKHPVLTLERFAADHEVDAESLRRKVDSLRDRPTLSLWHGTNERHAESILQNGFRTRGRIWFSRQLAFARSHATRKARRHSDRAVVFRCSIDPREYPDFEGRGPHFAFRCSHISSDVIRRVFRLELMQQEAPETAVLVPLPQDRSEVLRWINRYLSAAKETPITEEHPVALAMWRWAGAQRNSRGSATIPEEEMLMQLSRLSMQQAARLFGVGVEAVGRWVAEGRFQAKSLGSYDLVPFHAPQIEMPVQEEIITLWHGTTEKNATSIQEQGFRTQQVWFTTKRSFARRVALGRARQRHRVPVVIRCEIDLSHYRFHGSRGHTYVFYRPGSPNTEPTVGSDVIRSVAVAERKTARRRGENVRPPILVEVAITPASGAVGIAWWVNQYLELEDPDQMPADHPEIQEIVAWVESEFAGGREESITAEEMEFQVGKHFPEIAPVPWRRFSGPRMPNQRAI